MAHPRYHGETDMDEFLKMDIFFVVTTVAVVVVSVLLAFVLIRVLRILKNIEDISLMVEAEGEKLREDIAHVRAKVKEEGVRVTHLFDFLGAGKPKRARKKS
jgi:hypothetical protein